MTIRCLNRVLARLAVTCVWAGPLAGAAAALTLEFPGEATQTGVRVERLGSYRLPVGPFLADGVDSRLTEGPLDMRAWRLEAAGASTLQLLVPLRDQVTGAGFRVIYECEAVICGGFDFRYGTEVLPEPDMHVDLGDFRYLAAERETAGGVDYISLIVSRAGDQGFVQVTRVGLVALDVVGPQGGDADVPGAADAGASGAGADANTPQASAGGGQAGGGGGGVAVGGLADGAALAGGAGLADGAEAPVPPVAVDPDGPLADRLIGGGAQVLPDLVFASGSAVLAEGVFASLTGLADFLRANPAARIVLVGHTDASGDLAANIALSRERARSVRQRLIGEFDIPPRQVQAEGVGYLAPRAPNDTDAGRLANRRVEVMLLTLGAQ